MCWFMCTDSWMDRVTFTGALQGYQCASSRSRYVLFVYIVSDFLKCFMLVCVLFYHLNR
jgi:hypothetical protein